MTVIAHARRFGLLALLCASAGAYGQYGERILEFDSVIEVKQNGSAVITETITVRANSDQIQRGIFRDLPMRGIRPERVLRDGQAEDYHLERGPIGTRIYIGSADRYRSPGE